MSYIESLQYQHKSINQNILELLYFLFPTEFPKKISDNLSFQLI